MNMRRRVSITVASAPQSVVKKKRQIGSKSLISVHMYVGLARTINIRCIYGMLGRDITKYTVICGVHIRFWPSLCICIATSLHLSDIMLVSPRPDSSLHLRPAAGIKVRCNLSTSQAYHRCLLCICVCPATCLHLRPAAAPLCMVPMCTAASLCLRSAAGIDLQRHLSTPQTCCWH